MDKKVKKYQSFLLDFLNEYAQRMNRPPEANSYVIADKENHHYQLVVTGWRGIKRRHTIPFHFDIVDDKIWVQLNNTDVDLDSVFEDAGIPKKDIVVGWHPESLRKTEDYEYAVA